MLYTIVSDIRDSKKVGLSIFLSVCKLLKMPTPLLTNIRIIIRISGERASHPPQENETISSELIFNILDNF